MVAPTSSGHSARVRLELHAGGECFRLSQFGGDVLIFDRGVVLPGTTGEVVARIDENEQRWSVSWEGSDLPREVITSRLEGEKVKV